MRLPDEPTAPEQWQVICWATIAVLVIMGVVGIYISFNAPEENPSVLNQVRVRSLAALGAAAALYLTMRQIKYYFD